MSPLESQIINTIKSTMGEVIATHLKGFNSPMKSFIDVVLDQ